MLKFVRAWYVCNDCKKTDYKDIPGSEPNFNRALDALRPNGWIGDLCNVCDRRQERRPIVELNR